MKLIKYVLFFGAIAVALTASAAKDTAAVAHVDEVNPLEDTTAVANGNEVDTDEDVVDEASDNRANPDEALVAATAVDETDILPGEESEFTKILTVNAADGTPIRHCPRDHFWDGRCHHCRRSHFWDGRCHRCPRRCWRFNRCRPGCS
ncbi:hypothetical protein IWQ61_003085 [Dispira simplex]|nr:hypothetical protein IWQ61_003085 [Dispira simplex]